MTNRKHLLCFALSMFFVLFLSSMAHAFTSQRLVIPYATVGDGWWSGLSIHNQSSSDQTYWVGIYDPDGDYIGGSCFTLSPRANLTDLIETFSDEGGVTGRVSIYVQTNADTNKFKASMFMGNSDSSGSQGFAFDTYESEDFEKTTLLICLPLLPVIPVIPVIPVLPLLP